MTSNSRTKETAIKGLVNDIKGYCAALTPPAPGLLSHLLRKQGGTLEVRKVTCCLHSLGSVSV